MDDSILIVYLGFLAAYFLFEAVLSVLNMRTVNENSAVPALFRETFSPEEYRKSRAYTLAGQRFALFALTVSTLYTAAVVLAGLPGRIDRFVFSAGWPERWSALLVIALTLILFQIPALGLGLFRQFRLEARFGFNTMTLKTFLFDRLKGMLIAVLLGVPLLLGLFLFMDRSGELWWIYGFVFFTTVQLMLSFLYPVLIAPLFNRFEPLEEGALRDALTGLAEDLQFRTAGIFVMDGSRRSRHSNAYFTGFGKYRRIVLYDTLIKQLSIPSLSAVLVHEIGHYKKKHIPQRLAVSLLLSLGSFFIIDLLLGWTPLYAAFGYAAPSYHAILIIVSLLATPFTFFLNPLASAWSRRHEYQADHFAAEHVGAEAMSDALLKLGKDNLSNLTPHRLYSFYHYSHPTLSERLGALAGYSEET